MDEDQLRQNDPTTDSVADNTDEHQTPDDALQPQDDVFNPARDEEKLEEDNDTPAAPATDVPTENPLPADHPEFDNASDNDEHQTYDEGATNGTDANAQDGNTEEPPRPLDPQA